MVEVVGISFSENNRVYYFSPNHLKLKMNITIIAETERGLQFGKVVREPFFIEEKNIVNPLKNIIRVATKQDYYTHKKNLKEADNALKKCKELVKKEQLKMQVLDCTYTFDKSQLMFRFLAETRIDFRNLAKELASIYKTRIELRQVGVRDKAKEMGGIGPCGRVLCCSCFLNDFDSVSINMAKNQNISLNQTKINGSCGRLLCCLKYEDANYLECRECLPKIGEEVTTNEGRGKVTAIDILNRKYTVEIVGVGSREMSVECGKN